MTLTERLVSIECVPVLARGDRADAFVRWIPEAQPRGEARELRPKRQISRDPPGSLAELKIPCPQGRVGSTPTSGIAATRLFKRNPLEPSLADFSVRGVWGNVWGNTPREHVPGRAGIRPAVPTS